jgi:hypothetical protein
MTKRKARKLYGQALDSYRLGYIDGAKGAAYKRAHPDSDFNPYLGPLWHEGDPAFKAGHDAGLEGTSFDERRLPLDVWARVLAKALEP